MTPTIIAFEDHNVTVTRTTDEMVFKVTFNNKVNRTRTFKGETAWCDAERYASDVLGYFICV